MCHLFGHTPRAWDSVSRGRLIVLWYPPILRYVTSFHWEEQLCWAYFSMKWSLNVLIARSDALRRWIHGGASWKLMSSDLSNLCKVGEVSLSSVMCSGLIPLARICSWRSLKTLTNFLSDIFFLGRINILLLWYLYNTNIYLFPLLGYREFTC